MLGSPHIHQYAVGALVFLAFLTASGTYAQEWNMTRMVGDRDRPYVYAIHKVDQPSEEAFLVFINTQREEVEDSIPVSANSTDLAVHYGEERLYVVDPQRPLLQVVDLATKETLETFPTGGSTNSMSAGRPGRIYLEFRKTSSSVDILAIDTRSGEEVGRTTSRLDRGDGEVDPSGNFYYHGEGMGISDSRLHKIDISDDSRLRVVASSDRHSSRSQSVVMSPDGSRVFWLSRAFDADLNLVSNLGVETYATTAHGDLSFSSTEVFNVHTGLPVASLPFETTVMAVSGNPEKLVLFDPTDGGLTLLSPAELLPDPERPENPAPEDGAVVPPPLPRLSWDSDPNTLGHDVYLGTDEAAVRSADRNSPEYLGAVDPSFIELVENLSLGETYYWRVDPRAYSGTATGDVWTFTMAPLAVTPNPIDIQWAVPAPPHEKELRLESHGMELDWSVTDDADWLNVQPHSGSTPATILVTARTRGLSPGAYEGALTFQAGELDFTIDVHLELAQLRVSRLLADLERPCVYGLHPGLQDKEDAILLFIDTETRTIEKAIPIGMNPSDLDVNYGDGRLYVMDYRTPLIRVVDLTSREELLPLQATSGLRWVAAGRPGRIYCSYPLGFEDGYVIDTVTGQTAGRIPGMPTRDSKVDPLGRYLYRSTYDGSAHVVKYDLSRDDNIYPVATSMPLVAGSALVMTPDGSRIFWSRNVFDQDLLQLKYLGADIHATTAHGELAVTQSDVLDVETGESLYTLPTETNVLAVSGDQRSLVTFDQVEGLRFLSLEDLAEIPWPQLSPEPPPGGTVVIPLSRLSWDTQPAAIGYDIYFGSDPTEVATADTSSPVHLGRVDSNFIDFLQELVSGETYYWRVDVVRFNGTTIGSVWSFTVAPVVVAPNSISVATIMDSAPVQTDLELEAYPAVDWTVLEASEWLTVEPRSGSTPQRITVTLDPFGLTAGIHKGAIQFHALGMHFAVPVDFEVMELDLTLLAADCVRPYIYGIHKHFRKSDEDFLAFINTDTQSIETVIPIGSTVTDLAFQSGDSRLYLGNSEEPLIRVVDLDTRREVDPITVDSNVISLSAAGKGIVYYESPVTFIHAEVHILDTDTGAEVGTFSTLQTQGHGETDATGEVYYHAEAAPNTRNIAKFDVSNRSDVRRVAGNSAYHTTASRIVLSPQGSLVFWGSHVYDSDLHLLRHLPEPVHAAALQGSLAFSSTEVFNTHTGDRVADLPFETTLMAVSGDDTKIALFDPENRRLEFQRLSALVDLPGVPSDPEPAHESVPTRTVHRLSWEAGPNALSHDVYLGLDPVAVRTADRESPEYLGRFTKDFVELLQDLLLGETYYWRVDAVGVAATVTGELWNFTLPPVKISPEQIAVTAVTFQDPVATGVSLEATRPAGDWVVIEKPEWVTCAPSAGTAPQDLQIIVDPLGLSHGTHEGTLVFSVAGLLIPLDVELTVNPMVLTRMLADLERPYIYALHWDPMAPQGFLLFIDPRTEQISHLRPLVAKPFDMTISQGDHRLYVSLSGPRTLVMDLDTQEEIETVSEGPAGLKINAGRPGRVYYENSNRQIPVQIFDTETWMEIGRFGDYFRDGDSEVDPTGRYYYHGNSGISSTSIYRYDISDESQIQSLERRYPHYVYFGFLTLNADGSRLFWGPHSYDAEINLQVRFTQDIVAITRNGELAFGATQVFNAHTGEPIAELPVSTRVMAVSVEPEKLVLFDPEEGALLYVYLHDLVGLPAPGLNPEPQSGSVVILPVSRLSWELIASATSYDVYLGTERDAVAAADLESPEYLGRVDSSFIDLMSELLPGVTYHWRIDVVGYTGTTRGEVWSFTAAPVVISPQQIEHRTVTGGPPVQRELDISADAEDISWSVSENSEWLSVTPPSGSTPQRLHVTLAPSGLTPGIHNSELEFQAGGMSFTVEVKLELLALDVDQFVADLERPYVYGIHRGQNNRDDAFLLLINSEIEQLEKVLPIGTNPTDMTVHYGESRLYVTDYGQPVTHVVDLETFEELEPLELGTHVMEINAGRPGRLYYGEGENAWRPIYIVDTTTGEELGTLPAEGGRGKTDCSGTAYFHVVEAGMGKRITKWDISTDEPELVAEVERPESTWHEPIPSPDGARLFEAGDVYDGELNQIGRIPGGVKATSFHGDLAVTRTRIYETRRGTPVAPLPDAVRVASITGDQQKVVAFESDGGQLIFLPLDALTDVPARGLNPRPDDGSVVIHLLQCFSWDLQPTAVAYEVFFGTTLERVAEAHQESPEFLGRVESTCIKAPPDLDPGATYYWRIDVVGLEDTHKGAPLSFTVGPLLVSPDRVARTTVVGAMPVQVDIELASERDSVPWLARSLVPWLTVNPAEGITPTTIQLTLDPAKARPGYHTTALQLDSQSLIFDVTVDFEVEELQLTKMVADPEKPRIYGLQRGETDFQDSFVVVINTDTERIEKTIPSGSSATDLTVQSEEERLYVANPGWIVTPAIDLSLLEATEPLKIGASVSRINAGRAKRLYYISDGTIGHAHVIDTDSGSALQVFSSFAQDAEFESTHRFYYQVERYNIVKYDVSNDSDIHVVATSNRVYTQGWDIVLSADGSRVFYGNYVFDDELYQLEALPVPIYAATSRGGIAFSANRGFDTDTKEEVIDLPVTTRVMAVSRDDRKLFLFDEWNRRLEVVYLETSSGFIRGEVNFDGALNIADPIRVLRHLVMGGMSPGCESSADADDNGAVNTTDVVYVLNYLFLGGPAPVAPWPLCGEDATPDSLTCETFDPCVSR